jgi:uncharacterized protein (DUF305 family)
MSQSTRQLIINRTIGLLAIVTLTGITAACSSPKADSTPSSESHSTSAKGMEQGKMKHGEMSHNMDLGPADANFDLRFIDAMIPHHEGAVVMAKEILNKSQRPELKKLAQAIIAAQDQEIAQMQAWRKAWYPKAPATPMMWHASMKHMMPMDESMRKSMRMDVDLGSADANFDKRFIDAMIPHHEAALVMAKDLQGKTQRPELKKLAQDILSSQQAEINQMKQWRTSW